MALEKRKSACIQNLPSRKKPAVDPPMEVVDSEYSDAEDSVPISKLPRNCRPGRRRQKHAVSKIAVIGKLVVDRGSPPKVDFSTNVHGVKMLFPTKCIIFVVCSRYPVS